MQAIGWTTFKTRTSPLDLLPDEIFEKLFLFFSVCPTELGDAEIGFFNSQYFSVDASIKFSWVPKDDSLPMCQMISKAMSDNRGTVSEISLTGLSKYLGNQLVLGIASELLSAEIRV